MNGTDSGLRFWLSYVEHRGGLVDTGTVTVLAVLPEPVQAQLGLPETVSVTSDPEVARDDGALLLTAGHPVLTLSAETVLGDADVGRRALPWPGDQLPAAADLLEQARDSFPVDHGRIDLAAPPSRAYLPALRAGAMIRYLVAGDEAFQERSECLLDATTGRELPETVRKALDPALTPRPDTEPVSAPDSTAVLPFDLDRAVDAAHQLLHDRAGQRLDALNDDGRHARTGEIARTEAYYRDVLAGIERRSATATPDRRDALDARAEATRQERTRRLAEIRDKHQASHTLTPYRLHLLLLPAVVLPVDVMRGPRRFPQHLVWLWSARCFRPLPCPSCGSDRPLVAGKTALGCEACLSRPDPPAPASSPSTRATGAVTTKPTETKERRPGRNSPAASARPAKAKPPAKVKPSAAPSALAPARPSPARIGSIGDGLVLSFWQSVANNERKLAKQLLADSPATTAVRLFGVRGLACAVGIPPEAALVAVSGGTRSPRAGPRFVCEGELQTGERGQRFPFALVWRLQGNRATVDEILPHATRDPDLLPQARFLTPGLRPDRLPGQAAVLDPVAARLADVVLPVDGLPLLMRCLTAWWRTRTPDLFDPTIDPDVTAAAVLRLVSWRCGSRVSTADCATRFGVAESQIKAVEADLKARLRLGPNVVW